VSSEPGAGHKSEREEKRNRETVIAQRCHQLAANPTDSRRLGDGVPFDVLKTHFDEAIESCERALQQNPQVLQFQYQLGRALQFKDRKRAMIIHERLVKAGYPAAFDNLGWLLITERNNYGEAVRMFQRGVQLDDPDSMVSLAEMIGQGRAVPRTPNETKMQLYARAARLGHARAAQAIHDEQEKERQRAYQLEEQRRALEMFGQVLRSIPRR
jgi:tetratricopeptide (TPR) repeat protein